MMKLALLGATGSIGRQTLDVLRLHRNEIKLCAATCGSDSDALSETAREFSPALLGVARPREGFRPGKGRICGPDVNERAILESGCDTVLDAVVGMAGLKPVMTALSSGRRVLLANKEALVAGGELVMDAARKLDAANGHAPAGHMPPRSLTPVDSEHSAIFQCMAGHPARVKRLILTASGGPFRTWSADAIRAATPEQALTHPTWRMGGKVTIDSASLMNKGLEVIEACRLFSIEPGRVRVLVHPQSVIHSMVEFEDGSVIAQLATPDMRGPIAYALGWPDRIESGVAPLELAGRALTFEEPDAVRFPCLRLAYEALEAGGGAPCVMNAADEAAVDAFLSGGIAFGDIAGIVEDTLARFAGAPAQSVEQLIALGDEARRYAAALAAK
jgi:1-deoxy-D-xylulose-5-phosphate reductoisomerase